MLSPLRFGALELKDAPQTDDHGRIRLHVTVTDDDRQKYALLMPEEGDTLSLSYKPEDPFVPVSVNKTPLIGPKARQQMETLLSALNWPEGTEDTRDALLAGVRQTPVIEDMLFEHAREEKVIPTFKELSPGHKMLVVLLSIPLMLARLALNIVLLPVRLVNALLK